MAARKIHPHPPESPWKMRRISRGVHKVDGDCPDSLDNRYRVIIDLPGGKQYRTTVTGLREAERHYRAKREEIDHVGVPRADDRTITVRELLEPVLDAQARKRQHDPNTTRSYTSVLTNHFWPRWGHVRVRDLTDEDTLTEWIAEIVDTIGVSTARRCDQFLRTLLKAAVKRRIIPVNPLDDVPWVALAKGTPTYLPTWPEIMAIRNGMASQRGLIAGHREMSVAQHDVLAGTGVRIGECMAISPDDVDTEAQTITIRYQVKRLNDGYVFDDAKTDAGNGRVIPVPKFVLAALAATQLRNGTRTVTLPWVGPATPAERRKLHEDGEAPTRTRVLYFFSLVGPTAPANPGGFSTRLRRAGMRAGAKGTVRAHCYRHRYTTTLLDAGVPQKAVDYITGHESRGVTLGIYAHVTPEALDQARVAIDAAWQAHLDRGSHQASKVS